MIDLKERIAAAQDFLRGLGCGADPAEIAAPFAADLEFEIQGDTGVLPWIGHQSGRAALEQFVRDVRLLTVPESFEVEDLLSSDTRVAIIGTLKSKIKATGRTTASQFAIILTFADLGIVRFQMLEDSFDVSNAARTN